MNTKTTQKERVWKALQNGAVLTDYNGVYIGVGAVRSRISELIAEGKPIKKGWIKNEISGGAPIRTYYLETENIQKSN